MTASAAQPILASTLYGTLRAKSSEPSPKRRRVGTGCSAIDDALRGGFDYGNISCISGEKGTGKTAISNNLLATHLVANSLSSAAIIDTTGTFSALRLLSTLISHLRSQHTSKEARKSAGGSESGQPYDPDAGNASRPGDRADATTTAIDVEEDADEERAAAKMLDRVKIMRVFDFVGVIEAIGEIRDELERPQAAPAESSPMPSSPPPMPREPGMRRTVSKIGDSEDEDEEDMLFDSAAEAPEPPVSPHVEPVTETVSEAPPERISSEESGPPTGKTGMIIIDNITHVLSPLMKTDYVQAHTLLTTSLRSLTHLTRTHSICTVLINGAITPRSNPGGGPVELPVRGPNAEPSSEQPQARTQHRAEPEPHPSIFASNTARPALGRTFPFLVDVHVFVSCLPKERRDAAVVYGGGGGGGRRAEMAEMVNAVEVLTDRFGERVGRWGAFRVGNEGVEVRGVF